MPTIEVKVERAGYAEQFVQNLQGTVPDMLTQITEEIKNDVATHAPKHRVGNPKVGDVPLGQSFSATPAQQTEPNVWEAYIESSVPAKARAQEYGSGMQGPKMARYPITPKTARMLAFRWDDGPNAEKFPSHPMYYLKQVMHPGVYGQFYINETLRIWRPALRQRFGEAIRAAAVSGGYMRGLL